MTPINIRTDYAVFLDTKYVKMNEDQIRTIADLLHQRILAQLYGV